MSRRLSTLFAFAALPLLFAAIPSPHVPSPHAGHKVGGNYAVGFPWNSSLSVAANSGDNQVSFTVDNLSAVSSKTPTITCEVPEGWSCTVSPSTPTIPANGEVTVTATYSVGAATSDSLYVSVLGGGTGFGSIPLAITTQTPTRVRINVPGPYTSTTQTVHRSRPLVRADFVLSPGESTDTSRVKLWWRGVERTSQIRRTKAFIEWEVGAADSLVPGDSAQLRVQHCRTGQQVCTGEVVYVKLPNDNTPVVDFTGAPLETTGGGFASGFGPGVALNGAEIETGFSTPAYVSMGVGRSAGLVYSTRTSYPRALIPVDIKLPWPAGTADSVTARLYDGGVLRDTAKATGATCATGSVHACRMVLQADYASGTISGGVDRRWLSVEVRIWSGGTVKLTTDSTEVVLVDRRDSPYGSGWWPAGTARIYKDGADRILVGANGEATIFRGSADSVYARTPGGTTVLARVGATFELQPRGTTAKVVFDSTTGRLIKAVDQSGNRDSIVYGVQGRDSLHIDPLGKLIAFYYHNNTGPLDSIVSLPSDTATRRTTRVVIDSVTNQLRYDSLSSPTARPIIARYTYRTYSGVVGTAQLWSRAGRFGSDSVTILYDSTGSNRPIQARLLAAVSGGTVPVVQYRAVELQGWHAGRSLDSLYVEATDPLGHWARSRLNRYAQSTQSWDAIGTTGRSSYDDVGRLLWSEGKNGDSSRVYTDYDGLGRVTRTYIYRGSLANILRLDSLVYDGSSRVVKHIDSRGKVDSVAYDSAGRPNYHKDPAGNETRTWYRSNGLVDSTLVPLASDPQSVRYDATWSNPYRIFLSDSLLADSVVFDNYGRATAHMHRVRSTWKGSGIWRWSRSRSWIDVAGRTDSTDVRETLNCANPCNAPTTLGVVLHSTKYTKDSLGQVVTLQLLDGSTSYRYDRLGRVVKTIYPVGGSDSTIYDLAGNVTKTINRNGDVIQVWYDTRNRVDSSSVPRYGVIHSSYGGPVDQLTRTWVTGLVDSLGEVNPNRAYVFDARGRLTADTLWTGSVSRVTTHTYDSFERPSSNTDPLGTWTTKYETNRGIADTVIAAFGDTLAITYDAQLRPMTERLQRGSAAHLPKVDRTWSPTGELSTLATTTSTAGGYTGFNVGSWAQIAPGDGENLGITQTQQYTKQDGSGATTQTQVDSLQYDTDARLESWNAMKDGVLLVGGGGAYGGLEVPGSNRLLGWSDALGHTRNFVYDSVGNTIQRIDSLSGALACTFWYSYDGFNHLVAVRGKQGTGSTVVIARYAYDVTGARIAKRVYNTVGGGCSTGTVGYTRYAVAGSQVSFETDSAGSTILRRYFWGAGIDNLIAVQVGSSTDSTFYAGKDKLGSIRAWVRRDGVWRWGMRYQPWGSGIDSSGTAVDAPYRWTGREYDAELGWYYLRARYYDPVITRFTQEDPIGYAGGENLYEYTEGSPLEARDPTGLTKDLDAGWQDAEAAPSLGFWFQTQAFWASAFTSYGALARMEMLYRAHDLLKTVDAGSTVEVGCRPLDPPFGALGNHCAIRVTSGDGKHSRVGELEKGPGWTNNVNIWDGNSQHANDYTWARVATPEGMTRAEFASAVWHNFASRAVGEDGAIYSPYSNANSNHFVWEVIDLSGGVVPSAAFQGLGGQTPGICGGNLDGSPSLVDEGHGCSP